MIFVNKKSIVGLCSTKSEKNSDNFYDLQENLAELRQLRPDFIKIFNEYSLSIYAAALKLNQKIPTGTVVNGVCVALPPSGPDNESFNLVEDRVQEQLFDKFRKIFSPKAHLFFTNSLVASQIAIDFNYQGEITTINSSQFGIEQVYNVLEIAMAKKNIKQMIVLALVPDKSRIMGLLIKGQKELSDDFEIKTRNDFAKLLMETDHE